MTSPKRAEPANEHAEMLRDLAGDQRSVYASNGIVAAAAEIERLAARVRELEEEISMQQWGRPDGPKP